METASAPLTPATVRAERARAGLTQAELARRAGISRATLVNFEKGRGTPLRASLQALQSALTDRPRHKSRLAHVLRTLQKERPALEAQGVLHLAIFGSVARMEDTPESDLDVVADIDPGRKFDIFDLAGVAGDISRLLDIHVDVVERKSLKPSFLQEVEREQVHVF
jgi:hypothetical protein